MWFREEVQELSQEEPITMLYRINFYTSIRRGMDRLVEGPELDIKSMWTKFKAEFDAKIGVEPDIFCFHQTGDYITARLEVLREYQKMYGVHEDLESMFFTLIMRDHGFKLLEIKEVQLE